MSKHFDREACPRCGSENYDWTDYQEDFNGEEAWQGWRCRCKKCGCKFDMERIYELVDVSVRRAHGN